MTVYREGDAGYSAAWMPYDGFEIDYGDPTLTHLQKDSLESTELAKVQFWALKNEVYTLRVDTNNNFRAMAEKYGSISRDLVDTKKEIRESLDDTRKDLKESLDSTRTELKQSLDELPERMSDAIFKGLEKYGKKDG